jgi:hypothetical protein
MSLPRHLLDQAFLLATRRGKARSADVKRATSATYYAAFHFLAAVCADTLIGRKHRNSDAWLRVYRSLDHSKAKQEFRRYLQILRDETLIDAKVLFEFALLFVELQDLRHQADYDPRPGPLTRIGVIALAKRLDAVMEAFGVVEGATLRELATAILLKDRK